MRISDWSSDVCSSDLLGHVETPAKIGVDHLFPHLVTHFHEGSVAGDPGIVDQHVDRPDFSRHVRDATLAGFMIGNIPALGGDAVPFTKGPRFLVIARIIGHDLHPCIFQGDENCLSDPTGAPGYYRDAYHQVPPMSSY